MVAARIGRVWNVFRPLAEPRASTGSSEGRGLAQARVALVAFYLYAAAGIVGLVALRRRRHPIWPYLVLVGGRDLHRRDLVRGAALPHPGRRGAPRARGSRDRRVLRRRASASDETLSFPSAPPSTT